MSKNISINKFFDEIESKIFADADSIFLKMPNYLGVRAYLKVRIAFLKRDLILENSIQDGSPVTHIHQQKQVTLNIRQEGEQSRNDVTSDKAE